MITRINLGGTARNSSLTITRVGIEDLGSYSCVALNRWEFKTNFAFKAKSKEKIEIEDWILFSQGRYGRVERWVDVFWPWCRFVFVNLCFCIFGFHFFLLWFRSRQQTPIAVAHRSRGCRNSSLRCACSSLLLLQVKKKRKNGTLFAFHICHFVSPKKGKRRRLGSINTAAAGRKSAHCSTN